MHDIVKRPILLSVIVSSLINTSISSSTAARPKHAPPAKSPRYIVTDLGTLGDGFDAPSNSLRINDKGQIVGTSFTMAGPAHAFLWNHGKMFDLDTLPGDKTSIACGINNHGDVVGVSIGSMTRAVLWQKGKAKDLGSLGTGQRASINGINDRGDIIGSMQPSDKDLPSAFLWRNGIRTKSSPIIGPWPCVSGFAINQHGALVGAENIKRGDQIDLHAYVKIGDKITDLGSVPLLFDINNANECVGMVKTQNDFVFHACVWYHGKCRILPSARTTSENASAINDEGVIVGSGDRPVDHQGGSIALGLVWIDNHCYVLDSCVPQHPKYHIEFCDDINNRGQIVCRGYADSKEKCFLLTPAR